MARRTSFNSKIFNSTVAFLVCLWAMISCGYYALRSTTVFVWNDTVAIAGQRYELDNPLLWDPPGSIWKSLTDSFRGVSVEGYRPLSTFQGSVGLSMSADTNLPLTTTHYYITAAIVLGFLAVCSFLVYQRFTGAPIWALLGISLFLFSPPVLAASWVVVAGFQSIVPLMICLGLLLYWRVIEANRGKSLYFVGLCIVLLIGPWFREFVGILPILIGFLEIKRAGRFTGMILLSALFFLHALFPTAIIKFLFFPELPLQPVYAMGLLNDVLDQSAVANPDLSWFTQRLIGIKWNLSYNFLNLFPPLLLGLVFLSYISHPFSEFIKLVFEKRIQSWMICWNTFSWSRLSQQKLLLKLANTIVIPLIFLSGLLFFWMIGNLNFLGVWLCLGIGFVALRYDVFLAYWFLLSLLPFYKIYTQITHLAYVLLPASIILAKAIEELFLSTKVLGLWLASHEIRGSLAIYKSARGCLGFLLSLILGSQLLNIYGSYQTVKTVNQGILAVSNWFETEVPKGSIVVANGLHAEDIRLFSKNHILPYYVFDAGVSYLNRSVEKPAELQALLEEANATSTPLYWLDIHFKRTPETFNYNTHKYVLNQSVATDDLGVIHTTEARYPYLDPFLAFVPRPSIPFLGAPDLVNDFYRGAAQNGQWFTREIYAQYHVYKVTGTTVDLWDPLGAVSFIQGGYHGFDVLELNGRYFAIPQGEGAFDLERAIAHQYSRIYISNDYEALLDDIEDDLPPEVPPPAPSPRPIEITLVTEGYHGFDILKVNQRYFAIPQGEGMFDLERARNRDYSKVYVSRTYDQLLEKIDRDWQQNRDRDWQQNSSQ